MDLRPNAKSKTIKFMEDHKAENLGEFGLDHECLDIHQEHDQ
jgi:hypothetical protein